MIQLQRVRTVLANVVVGSPIWHPRLRSILLGALGASIGKKVRINPYVRFLGALSHISIGEECFINSGVTFGGNAPVQLGRAVYVGPNALILPTTHEIGPAQKRAGQTVANPITVNDGAWLGAGAIVLSGVEIGAGTIIAAGAVVTTNADANSVYGGVPARRLRNDLPQQ